VITGRYSLLFVLTTGSHFDFAGAKHFSRATSSRTLDAVELVLCLDGLVGGLGRDIGPEGAALRLVSSTPLAKGEGAGSGDPGENFYYFIK
jgi:hypothetical protein